MPATPADPSDPPMIKECILLGISHTFKIISFPCPKQKTKKNNIIINIIKYSLFLYMCLAGETLSLLINEVKIVRKNI